VAASLLVPIAMFVGLEESGALSIRNVADVEAGYGMGAQLQTVIFFFEAYLLLKLI